MQNQEAGVFEKNNSSGMQMKKNPNPNNFMFP